MYANKPEMAARWQKETPKGKKLPEKVKHKTAAELGAAVKTALAKLAVSVVPGPVIAPGVKPVEKLVPGNPNKPAPAKGVPAQPMATKIAQLAVLDVRAAKAYARLRR
jgi:hypothetical protein